MKKTETHAGFEFPPQLYIFTTLKLRRPTLFSLDNSLHFIGCLLHLHDIL